MVKDPSHLVLETEETIVIRQQGAISRHYCASCHSMTDMIRPHLLASISGVSEREIFRLIELGVISCVENGQALACTLCYSKFITET